MWTIAVSCGSVRSASSAKPAIASTNSSRATIGAWCHTAPSPASDFRVRFVLTAGCHTGSMALQIDFGGHMTLTHQEIADQLAQTRLFAGVDAAGRGRIAERMTEVDLPADRVIARQGEIGTGFFIVASGRVRVVRDGDTIAELGPGQFFGELSVIDRLPRVAQVITSGPT